MESGWLINVNIYGDYEISAYGNGRTGFGYDLAKILALVK